MQPGQFPPAPFVVAAHEMLDELYAETERLLREKESAIHHLANALIERDELIGDELEEVFVEVERRIPSCSTSSCGRSSRSATSRHPSGRFRARASSRSRSPRKLPPSRPLGAGVAGVAEAAWQWRRRRSPGGCHRQRARRVTAIGGRGVRANPACRPTSSRPGPRRGTRPSTDTSTGRALGPSAGESPGRAVAPFGRLPRAFAPTRALAGPWNARLGPGNEPGECRPDGSYRGRSYRRGRPNNQDREPAFAASVSGDSRPGPTTAELRSRTTAARRDDRRRERGHRLPCRDRKVGPYARGARAMASRFLRVSDTSTQSTCRSRCRAARASSDASWPLDFRPARLCLDRQWSAVREPSVDHAVPGSLITPDRERHLRAKRPGVGADDRSQARQQRAPARHRGADPDPVVRTPDVETDDGTRDGPALQTHAREDPARSGRHERLTCRASTRPSQACRRLAVRRDAHGRSGSGPRR